jgi:hypothetical protein
LCTRWGSEPRAQNFCLLFKTLRVQILAYRATITTGLSMQDVRPLSNRDERTAPRINHSTICFTPQPLYPSTQLLGGFWRQSACSVVLKKRTYPLPGNVRYFPSCPVCSLITTLTELFEITMNMQFHYRSTYSSF